MTVSAALCGGVVGTSLHMLSNAIRKLPLSRHPWGHVGCFVLGSYAAIWHEKKGKSLLVEVNELRADKGMPPLVNTETMYPGYLNLKVEEAETNKAKETEVWEAIKTVFNEERGHLNQKISRVSEAKTREERAKAWEELDQSLPKVAQKIFKQLNYDVDEEKIKKCADTSIGPEFDKLAEQGKKLRELIDTFEPEKVTEYNQMRQKMEESSESEAILISVDATLKRLNEHLLVCNETTPEIEDFKHRLEEGRRKVAETIKNGGDVEDCRKIMDEEFKELLEKNVYGQFRLEVVTDDGTDDREVDPAANQQPFFLPGGKSKDNDFLAEINDLFEEKTNN